MKLYLKNSSSFTTSTDCLILPIFEKKQLSSAGDVLDKSLKGALSHFLKRLTTLDNITEMAFFTPNEKTVKATQILLVHVGDKKQLTIELFKKAMEKVAATIESSRYKNIAFVFDDITLKNADIPHAIRTTAIALQQAIYRFEKYKSKPKTNALEQVTFFTEKSSKQLEAAIKQAQATVSGMNFMMDLANCPPNICHPDYLATQAQQLAKQYKSLTVKIIDDKALKKLGAGAILAVGQGSIYKPKMIIIEYTGASKTTAPHVLVGKGITFDTGGNNLKSFDGMLGMKYDMSGAASVFGTLKAVAELKLNINVVGMIAAAENMPGAEAYRPEDIITSLSGQTIEVLNTDAEGRLVLCDALTYAERYKPKSVIDIATLTGAIITCLGDVNSGLFSNNDALAEKIQQAAKNTLDGVWRLPMSEAYDAMINSPVADIKNIGGPAAGSITAACFLARFTQKYPWAHLDVAGTASVKAGLNRKSTGRPVPVLIEYLLQQ
jgi:leucyl aminopeptidase